MVERKHGPWWFCVRTHRCHVDIRTHRCQRLRLQFVPGRWASRCSDLRGVPPHDCAVPLPLPPHLMGACLKNNTRPSTCTRRVRFRFGSRLLGAGTRRDHAPISDKVWWQWEWHSTVMGAHLTKVGDRSAPYGSLRNVRSRRTVCGSVVEVVVPRAALWRAARCASIQYMAHLPYRLRKKIGRTRARRPLEGARMRHQRPCRCPLVRPERAALALWARPVHASSMVESTAYEHVTHDGDANVVVSAEH